ncbi:BQ2448_391 [Microbotryum intermedium]|uniref:BQ2448_391 protein n=1 Tax=Microbotryum intermedium TaxID=269621 RepID=A0A238F2B7_9BASI|nr:BQ2448_391 [Microbotryum intermedium]
MLRKTSEANNLLGLRGPPDATRSGGRGAVAYRLAIMTALCLRFNPIRHCSSKFISPYAVHEIMMKDLSYQIRTSKVDWQLQRLSAPVLANWKQEAMSKRVHMPANVSAVAYMHKFRPLEKCMIDRAFEELEELARLLQIVGNEWRIGCFDSIFECDRLVPEPLHSKLVAQLAQLGGRLGIEDRRVLGEATFDLIDSTFYPIVNGRTWIRDAHGPRQIALPDRQAHERSDDYLSPTYQCLPTECSVNPQGQVRIDSYINNLHPDVHVRTYDTIADILSRFVPLFDQTLSALVVPVPRTIPVRDCKWYEEFDEEEWTRWNAEFYEAGKELEDAMDGDIGEWEQWRPIIMPRPHPDFVPSSPEVLRWRVEHPEFSLKGRSIQIFVKLKCIELSPDRPDYGGTTWEVEGLKNECIVATGVFCYDQENVTESNIDFRGTHDRKKLPPGYEIDCHGVLNVFGGFRKLLVFHLVDPTERILSTRDIAPQQPTWIDHTIIASRPAGATSPGSAIPLSFVDMLLNELWCRILHLNDGPMTWEEMQLHRENMSDERFLSIEAHSADVYERSFYD